MSKVRTFRNRSREPVLPRQISKDTSEFIARSAEMDYSVTVVSAKS